MGNLSAIFMDSISKSIFEALYNSTNSFGESEPSKSNMTSEK